MNPDLIAALQQAGLLDATTADQLRRQLDPDVARAHAEDQLIQAVQGGLAGQQARVLDLLAQTEYDPVTGELAEFWRGEDTLLWSAIRPTVLAIVTERATLAAVASNQTFDLVNERVIDWADSYYIDPDGDVFGSIPNLNLTARTQFSRAFVEWQRGELGGRPAGLPQLIQALTPAFGPVRAEAIAVTETTRLFVQSRRLVEASNPFTVAFRWLTAADERICEICGPRHGETRRKEDDYSGGVDIPAHPRCRCDEAVETAQTLRIPFVSDFVFKGA